MTHSEAMHSRNDVITVNTHSNKPQSDFVKQARAQIEAMNRMADEVTQELELPPETKYDILAIVATLGEMETFPYSNRESHIEDTLVQWDAYIRTQARKSVSYLAFSPEVLDMEIDELAQRTRIKLWRTLQCSNVMSLKPYIRRIIHTEMVDMLRHRKAIFPLFLDPDGELSQGQVVVTGNEEVQDPAETVEQEETISQFIANIVGRVTMLPPRQQYAVICALKDEVSNLPQLASEFTKLCGDIDEITWPDRKKDEHILRASLSIARKKLRSAIHVMIAP